MSAFSFLPLLSSSVVNIEITLIRKAGPRTVHQPNPIQASKRGIKWDLNKILAYICSLIMEKIYLEFKKYLKDIFSIITLQNHKNKEQNMPIKYYVKLLLCRAVLMDCASYLVLCPGSVLMSHFEGILPIISDLATFGLDIALYRKKSRISFPR